MDRRWLIFIILLGVFLFTGVYFGIRYSNLKKENLVLLMNEKAYASERDSLKTQSNVFQFTIEQLEYLNDSILSRLDETRKELKIKNKDIKSLEYLLSQASKRDTIVFRDTLFLNPELDMDTTIGDEWYQLSLGLRYPNIIETNPSFKSEKYILTSYRKETVNPPNKCFLVRWFQKKHKVLEVNVVEKNPYIENREQKFIEIIK